MAVVGDLRPVVFVLGDHGESKPREGALRAVMWGLLPRVSDHASRAERAEPTDGLFRERSTDALTRVLGLDKT